MANVWFPGVRFSTDAPSVPNALHGTVPAFTPPLPFASGSTKIVTLFTLAAAQVLPSNVHSASCPRFEDPQREAASNESNRTPRIQASCPFRRLPFADIQPSRGPRRSHPNKGSVRLFLALTVPTVRGRNGPAM